MKTDKTWLQRATLETIEQLRISNKETLPIEGWGDGETLFVSRNKNDLYSTETVKVDGETFFVGTYRHRNPHK